MNFIKTRNVERHICPPFYHLTHIIGYFVIETCHKWVHGSVQLWKNKNNDDFVIFQDNKLNHSDI
jgi:hypothetical protein